MTRARKIWLVVVVAQLIALGWLGWRVKESLWPARADSQVSAAPSQSTGISTALPPPVDPTVSAGRAVATGEGRRDGLASPSPRPKDSAPDAYLQLAFVMPQSVKVGEGFDARVELSARQPIGRIVVEVAYDPALLKARTPEEIDYASRGAGERMFRTETSSDGHVELSLVQDRGSPQVLPASVPLVQFEALAPGIAQVRVESIVVTDPTDRTLTWSAMGRVSEIVIH